MPKPTRAEIEAVRTFNRFYTRAVGALRKDFLGTPWSLTEMRVLFEIANGRDATASDIGKALDLDTAYLSRLLQKFEKDGLITRVQSPVDGRVSHLGLSAKGRKQFTAANDLQIGQTTGMLARLAPAERDKLVEAMGQIRHLLGDAEAKASSVVLRNPRSGDFGWMVERHAILYGEEYGWRGPFEGVCAQIVADFIRQFDPKLEKCWIAEVGSQRAGCVMLVKDDPKAKKADVARIRLLLLEPEARGLGLGRRLVGECISFARARGYRRVTLWTHKELEAARAIYAKFGFVKTGEEAHDDWGGKATSEFWDLEL